MELQKQCVSLDLAKKMKELGFEQESYFYWSNRMDLKNWRIENRQFFQVDKRCDISAYTVTELGEMLPNSLVENEITGNLFLSKEFDNTYGVGYMASGYEGMYSLNKPEWIYADTEADARAKMLIYLKEQKLI